MVTMISFVIPAYNEEGCLRVCLLSIKKEITASSCEAEIIVVNNASTDRTGEIARSISGVIVVDEPQKGLTHARSAGFKASHGEIIANIDADVRLPTGWLTAVTQEFRNDPKLVLVSGPQLYDDLPFFPLMITRIMYGVEFCVYLLGRFILRQGTMVQGGNFVIRRDALEKIDGYDTTIAFYGEDADIGRRVTPLGDTTWSFRFGVNASGRRFKHEGVFLVMLKYSLAYLWINLTGKPFSQKYSDVR